MEMPREEPALTGGTFSPSLWENEEVQTGNAIWFWFLDWLD